MQYKTMLIPVKCSIQDYKYLLNCNLESAKAWNEIVKISNRYRDENNGEWISQNQLQKETKGICDLHAKGIQQVILRYVNARKSTLRARNGNGEDCKYPHRMKKFMNTIWDYQAIKIKENEFISF